MARLLKWVSSEGIEVMLDGSTGVKARRGVSGLDSPPRALTIEQRVNSSGGLVTNERTPTQPILLPIHVDLFSADLSALIRAFRYGHGTLVSGSGRELRKVVYESGLEGLWDVQNGGVEGLGHRQFLLSLSVLDPYWYGLTREVELDIGASTVWSPHLAWSPHIPWSGGSSQTVSVEGEEEPFPVFYVEGPVTNLTVGLGTGRAWEVVPALTSGGSGADVVTIDHRPGTRGPRYGATPLGFSEGMINWGILSELSRADWPLPIGNNSLVLGGADSTGATIIRMVYEERWYSP